MKGRTVFKIVLDSYNANSYTGIQHNASYMIDLRKVLPNPADYGKQYYMTTRYEMISGSFATTTLTPENLYYLNINLGKPLAICYTGAEGGVNPANNVATLRYTTDLFYFNGTTSPQYGFLSCNPSDNRGIIVNDIKNISSITLTLINATTNEIFNSANGGTTNTNTKYICVLQFEEI